MKASLKWLDQSYWQNGTQVEVQLEESDKLGESKGVLKSLCHTWKSNVSNNTREDWVGDKGTDFLRMEPFPKVSSGGSHGCCWLHWKWKEINIIGFDEVRSLERPSDSKEGKTVTETAVNYRSETPPDGMKVQRQMSMNCLHLEENWDTKTGTVFFFFS